MNILGVIKNKSKSSDLMKDDNGNLIGFKDFLVSKMLNQICKKENITGTLIDILKLECIDLKRFLSSYDRILTFSNNHNILHEHYELFPNKFIFIEDPIFNRDIFKSSKYQKYFRIMYQTHLGNSFINKYNTNQIRDGFNFNLKQIAGKNHIILINQMVGDSAIRPVDPFIWLEQTAFKLIKKTKKEIIVRDHPLQKNYAINFIDEFKKKTGHSLILSKNKYIEEDLKDASLAIMFSSGSCVDCLLNGVPVICTDPRSYVYEIVPNNIDEIGSLDDISLPPLKKFLSALSNTHFTLNEIINGDFLAFSKNLIK